jgi:hypothetical protein
VIDMMAPQYPEVSFVVPHLGSFGDDWRAHQQVVDQLVRYPNVYSDTSGVRRFDYIVQAVKRAGPHKLLFGSDGPWLHPAVELHKIRLLGLPKEKEALIVGGNSMGLLRMDRPAFRPSAEPPAIPTLHSAFSQPSQLHTESKSCDRHITCSQCKFRQPRANSRGTLILVKETRNITLSLPSNLLKRVKRLAADRGTSVSAMMADALKRLADEDRRYEAARKRSIAAMRSARSLDTEGRHSRTRDQRHEC